MNKGAVKPKESKVQKVARGVAKKQVALALCGCGGERVWARVAPQDRAPRMMKYCEGCGAMEGRR